MGVRTRAAVIGLLLFAACGGDPKSTATLAASSSTTSEPSTTAVSTTLVVNPSSTTKVTTTPTTAKTTATTGQMCSLASVGAGATNVTTKPGDFDGNGTPDVLRAYKLGNDWHLRVELGGGAGGSDLIVPGIDPVSGMKAVGGFNLNDTVAEEAFAVVGSGASTTLVGIFVFANCSLVRVTENGNPASFAVGASVLNRSGISCVQGGALQTLSATAPPNTGTPFTVARQTWDVVGTALVFVKVTQSTIASNDPALAASAKFDCGGLSLS